MGGRVIERRWDENTSSPPLECRQKLLPTHRIFYLSPKVTNHLLPTCWGFALACCTSRSSPSRSCPCIIGDQRLLQTFEGFHRILFVTAQWGSCERAEVSVAPQGRNKSDHLRHRRPNCRLLHHQPHPQCYPILTAGLLELHIAVLGKPLATRLQWFSGQEATQHGRHGCCPVSAG